MRHVTRALGFVRLNWWWLLAAVGLVGVALLWWGEASVFILGLLLGGAGQGLADKGGDVTASPLSFVLPGYRGTLRLRHFVEGLLIGLGLACWALWSVLLRWEIGSIGVDGKAVGWQGPAVALAIVALFFGGMGIRTAGRALSYTRSRWSASLELVSFFLFILVVLASVRPDERSVIAWSWLLAGGLTLALYSWIRLGDLTVIHQGHRAAIQNALAPRVETRLKKWTRESRAEVFFREQIQRQAYFSARRYCWGELRRCVLPPLQRWRTVLIWLAAGALVSGVLGDAMGGLGFVALGLMAFDSYLPIVPDHALLLPVGRRERRAATLATAAVTCVMFAIFAVVAIGLSWLLGLLFSILPLERLISIPFLKADPAWFYWPCLLVPWAIAARAFAGWARRIAQGCLAAVLLLFAAGVYLLQSYIVPAWRIHAVCVCVWAAGWLLLLMALRARSQAGDLLTARG